MNYKAIDLGAEGLKEIKVDPAWANLPLEKVVERPNLPKFVKEIANPVNAIKGYDLPVSTFNDFVDGTMTPGSAAYESAISLHLFQYGIAIIVSNVINAHSRVLMVLFVHSW